MLGAAESIEEQIGDPFLPHERSAFDAAVAPVAARADDPAIAAAWALGRTLSDSEAAAFALSAVAAQTPH
jgi:hypothetical protein